MWLLKEPSVLTTELLRVSLTFLRKLWIFCLLLFCYSPRSLLPGHGRRNILLFLHSEQAVWKPPLLSFSGGLSPVPEDASSSEISKQSQLGNIPHSPCCPGTCHHMDLLISPPFHLPQCWALPPHPVLLISSDNRFWNSSTPGSGNCLVWIPTQVFVKGKEWEKYNPLPYICNDITEIMKGRRVNSAP